MVFKPLSNAAPNWGLRSGLGIGSGILVAVSVLGLCHSNSYLWNWADE